MTSRQLLVWIVTCLIWGTVWIFIKLGVRDVPPTTFAAGRLLLAVSIAVPVAIARRAPRPTKTREWWLIAWSGVVLLGINYALLNWGIQFISSGLTAVLQATTPAFAMVFAHYALHDEKITALKTAAIVVGIVGVGIVFWHQLDLGGEQALAGSLAQIASSACVAIGYVMMRRGGSHLDPSVITSGQMVSAALPLIAYAWVTEGNPLRVPWTATAFGCALYLAVLGSVIAAWLNYWLLKRIGATKMLLMGLVEPLIAVVLGAVILNEQMTGRTLVGGVLILVSVAVVMTPER